ncbi:zinc finger protein 76-like isoform X2 [Lineus longissimus]
MDDIGPSDLSDLPSGSMEEQLLHEGVSPTDDSGVDGSPDEHHNIATLSPVGDLDDTSAAALSIPQDEGAILSVPESGIIATQGSVDSGTLLQVPDTQSSSLSVGTVQGQGSSEQEVIGLLLQAQQNSSVDNPSSSALTGDANLTDLQAITLPDGTTAYIQQDGKLIEGQAVQLEDGSTAIVQTMVDKRDNQSVMSPSDADLTSGATDICGPGAGKFVEGQAVQLEDGTTAYIHSTPKEGFQAVQLEDGSTAYITSTCAQNLFEDSEQFDTNSLGLEPLGSQFEDSAADNDSKASVTTHESMTLNTRDINVVGAMRLTSERAIAMGDRAFRCSYDGCGRLYTTQHHLKVHERSHTGDRPFGCEFPSCGKAFATGYGLKSHTRVHTGEKPYKCPEETCDKAFKTSGDLQKHVRTHTGEKPFKCPFEGCDRSFTTSNIRKVHIRTHTGERPYICSDEGCGKAFASATNYKNHIRIHTGEKPYVCTIQGCGKRFTEYSSLYKHHVVHTHSKPYICNHCGKHYRQTSTLSMHKRTAHGDDSEDDPTLIIPPDGISENLGLEPQNKKMKMQHLNLDLVDEGEGTLVISDPQLAMVRSGESVHVVSQEGALSLGGPQQISIQQLPGVMSTGDQQQIYLVTDPTQLQALQQLASQHTAVGGMIPVSSCVSTITSDVLEGTDAGMDPDTCGDAVVTNQDGSMITFSS